MKEIVKNHWLQTLNAIAENNALEQAELASWTKEDEIEWGETKNDITERHIKKGASLMQTAELYKQLLIEAGEDEHELTNEAEAYTSIRQHEWQKKYHLE